jgi:hypothetical protein
MLRIGLVVVWDVGVVGFYVRFNSHCSEEIVFIEDLSVELRDLQRVLLHLLVPER